jgi:hypothetical protein
VSEFGDWRIGALAVNGALGRRDPEGQTPYPQALTLKHQRIQALERQVKRLKMEKEILRKSDHPLARRHVAFYPLIDQLQLDYPIIMLGAVLALRGVVNLPGRIAPFGPNKFRCG